MLTLQDFKYALRLLAKRPSFSILTIMVMALGIGLSVYLFSFLNTMAYKPLPFKDSETLIMVDKVQNGLYLNGGNLDLHDFYQIRTQIKGIAEVSALTETSANVSSREGARRYNTSMIEPNIFQMTRTKPMLGREFTESENIAGAKAVTIIGFDLWQNHFVGDPQVIGQSMRINGISNEIIGVMPQGYYFPRNSEIWLPMREDPTKLKRGEADNYTGIIHMAPGASIESINREMDVVMKRIEEKYPKTNAGVGAYAETFPMSVMGNGGSVFILSMYVVAVLLLLLASINVGNLLLSRAIERSKETAIRVALGAPRSRLIGQMLWESILICSFGGIIGLLVAAWGLEVTESITATFTDDKPFFWWKFGIDSYTIKLSLAFIIGTILITGLLPAWKNSGGDFNAVLRDGTRGTLGKKAGRLNRILVISEVFLSMTVLIAAAVMIIGTYNATNADYGADTANTLTARIRLTPATYDTPEKRAQFAKTLHSRLENSVGIGHVMLASVIPGDYTWRPTVAIDGKEYVNEQSYPRANYVANLPGTLSKLGVSLIEGRYFDSHDDGLKKNTVIVTESFVERHFGDQSAIGKRIRIVETDKDEMKWLSIVGVVEHTIQGQSFSIGVGTPTIFRPLTQTPRINLTVAMRLKSSEAVAIRTLRNTLASIDADLPAYLIKSYDQKIARNSAGIGFASKIFLIFGVVALVLASSGIYGVMSNTINQRTNEIGVKRALGANEKRITRDYLNAGFKQLLWGAIPGLIAGGSLGFALSQLMSTDNNTLAIILISIVTIIGSVVMFATYLPTKRALAMEPAEALHYE